MGNVENVVFTGFSSDRDSKGLSFRDLKFRFSSESTTGEEKEDAAKNVADKTLTFDKVEFNGNTRVYENK